MSDPSGPPEGVPERRKYQRVRLYMPGQLFNPVDEQTTDCKVLDLSAGGAAVQCDGNFPSGDKFVLYVTGFGRFEGRVVLHESGVLRLAFTIGESKQNRLKDMLALFVAEGITGITEFAQAPARARHRFGLHCPRRRQPSQMRRAGRVAGRRLAAHQGPARGGRDRQSGPQLGQGDPPSREGVAIQFVQMVQDHQSRLSLPSPPLPAAPGADTVGACGTG